MWAIALATITWLGVVGSVEGVRGRREPGVGAVDDWSVAEMEVSGAGAEPPERLWQLQGKVRPQTPRATTGGRDPLAPHVEVGGGHPVHVTLILTHDSAAIMRLKELHHNVSEPGCVTSQTLDAMLICVHSEE
jgi:hypothetical protein